MLSSWRLIAIPRSAPEPDWDAIRGNAVVRRQCKKWQHAICPNREDRIATSTRASPFVPSVCSPAQLQLSTVYQTGELTRGLRPDRPGHDIAQHRPQKQNPARGRALHCILRRRTTITCPCRPCHPCHPCRHHPCHRHRPFRPWAVRPPWLRSSTAATPPMRRFAARNG